MQQGVGVVPADGGMEDVAAVSEQVAWVVGGKGVILRTDDGGATWVPQNSTVTEGILKISAVSELVAWAVGTGGVILHTTDGGATWVQQGVGQVPNVLYQGVYALDDQRVWVTGDTQGGYGTIVYSEDGGATWVRQGSAATVPDAYFLDIVALDNGMAWTVGHGPHILYTDDFGANWTLQMGTMEPGMWDANGVYAVNEKIAWTVADYGDIYYTTDGGATWPTQPSGTGVYVMSVDALNAQTVWAVGQKQPSGGALIHTTDGGETWETQTAPVDTNMLGIMFVR